MAQDDLGGNERDRIMGKVGGDRVAGCWHVISVRNSSNAAKIITL
jgi:hypothetical protein